jgi:hypothetical protein
MHLTLYALAPFQEFSRNSKRSEQIRDKIKKMDTLISNATSTFQTTTGVSYQDVVAFMATQLKLVLGSGLGLLQALMPWIIALVVIGAIIYFLYRAFRFFKH